MEPIYMLDEYECLECGSHFEMLQTPNFCPFCGHYDLNNRVLVSEGEQDAG